MVESQTKGMYLTALRGVREYHNDPARLTDEEIVESHRKAGSIMTEAGYNASEVDNFGEGVYGSVFTLLQALAARAPHLSDSIEASLMEENARARATAATFDPRKVFDDKELYVMRATIRQEAARARVTGWGAPQARHAKGDGSAPYVPSSHASGGTLPRRTPRTSDPDLLDAIMGPSIHLRSQGRGK